MHNYRSGADNHSMVNQFEDEVSLRSLPMPAHARDGSVGLGSAHGVGGGSQQADQRSVHSTHVNMSNLNPPRSMSPVSSMSGDELSQGGRRSQRRRPLLDKQVSLERKLFYCKYLLSLRHTYTTLRINNSSSTRCSKSVNSQHIGLTICQIFLVLQNVKNPKINECGNLMGFQELWGNF